jgi:histone H3/H4
MVVRKSKVKEFVGTDYRVSADFYEALNQHVQETLKQAKQRAKSNDRKTLRPHDI